MDNVYVIAGLGNPGARYDNTRHNVGFDAVEFLAAKYNISLSKLKFKAVYGEGTIEGNRVLLVKPQTFMNLSGESVRDIVEFYKVPMSRLVVLYDDVDLAPGKIRVRPKGSAGTHNGMRNIIYLLGKDDFPRVRIGIGKAPANWDLADYVLSKYSSDDRKVANEGITKAVEAVVELIKSGADSAMNKFNK